MTADPDLVLVTSLAPGADPELQAAAITSWQRAGVTCCSVNSESEQERLKAFGADITFLNPSKTAEAAAGKPVPFVHDMIALACARYPAAKAIGIINDDILIREDVPFQHGLENTLETGVILGPRVDIASLAQADTYEDQDSPQFSVGYDLIIMPRSMALSLPPAPLALGMPFWDYWIPAHAVAAGWPLYAISDQVLLHVAHETVWDETVFVFFHALASAVLEGLAAQKSQEHRRFALAVDLLSQVYSDAFRAATGADSTPAHRDMLSRIYDRMQEVIVHHIKSAAQPMTLRRDDA